MECSKCHKIKEVQLVSSVSQLIFGGFNYNMVYRCAECEHEVSNNLLSTIKGNRMTDWSLNGVDRTQLPNFTTNNGKGNLCKWWFSPNDY